MVLSRSLRGWNEAAMVFSDCALPAAGASYWTGPSRLSRARGGFETWGGHRAEAEPEPAEKRRKWSETGTEDGPTGECWEGSFLAR